MTATDQSIWTSDFKRVFVVAFLNELAFSFMISLPGYFRGLGTSEGQIGLVVAVAAVASLALRPLLGRWLDVIGRKPIILGGALVHALSLLAFSTVEAYGPWMFVTRAVFTISEIGLFTALLTYAADTLPPERRARGLAYFGLSGLIPIGLASVASDFILESHGFDRLFQVAAAAAAASFLVALVLPARPRDEGDSRPRRSFAVALAQRDLIPMWVIALTFAVVLNVLLTYMRTFMDATGIGSVGLFFGIYSGCAVVIRVTSGRLLDVVGYRRVLIPTIVAYGAVPVALSFADTEATLVVAAVIGGVGHGLLFPILTSEIVRRARLAERGTALAMFTAVFDLAVFTAVPVIGRVIDTGGYPTAFRVTAVVLLAGVGLFVALDRDVDGVEVAESAGG